MLLGDAAASDRLRERHVVILVALLAVVTFGVTLRAPFVYDDLTLVGDPRVREPEQWQRLWTEQYFPDSIDNLYRPLVSMTFALQWWLHGERPWPYHAFNLAAHAAVAALVGVLATRLSRTTTAGLVGGAIFAVHPVTTEVVSSVAFRTDALCGIMLLSACVLMLGWLTGGRVAPILGLCAAALLCKEQAILAPVLLLLLWFCRDRSADERRVGRWLLLAVLFGFAAYVQIRDRFLPLMWDRIFLEWTYNPLVAARGIDRALLPVSLVGRYVALLVWPATLSLDYGGGVIVPRWSVGDAYFWIGAVAIVAWGVGVAVAWRRRAWPAVFCLAAAAAVYAPVSNSLVLIVTIFNERLIYLPLAFLCVGLALAVRSVPPRRLLPIAGVVVLALAVRSAVYASEWTDRTSFYVRSLERQPMSLRLHMLAFEELRDAGDLAAADAVARRAIERLPTSWEAWCLAAESAALAGDEGLMNARLARAAEVCGPVFYDSVVGAAGQVKARLRPPAATQPQP